ncbi:IclR family transcriptional regulator [Rhodovulum sp. BSW8]|uniref:IclR family transcriptional regulator n=1 Tax=Rhodovulum sp. BSW8 TaxID=2259645 RepID=UPI000DE2641F|nr:IclR family transcriptional regulator [Rhodovulum sp. BSW8]RBO53428.1 IclR family transcriptional regulator [Rhodovulum sp. BSW8]
MTILENAALVLRCFGNNCTDLTVSEVSERLGLPKASASRLLKSMRETGMLEEIGGSRRHRPGRMMLNLSAAFRYSSGVIGRARAAVHELSQAFGHTGYVSIRDNRQVLAIADFEGTNALRVGASIGNKLPAERCATGRSLLARLAPAEVALLYPDGPIAERLAPQLDRIRRTGYALSSQETTPGVDGLAVAVGDPVTSEAVSLCLVYPHNLVSDAERNAMIDAMIDSAGGIAEAVGDPLFRAAAERKVPA